LALDEWETTELQKGLDEENLKELSNDNDATRPNDRRSEGCAIRSFVKTQTLYDVCVEQQTTRTLPIYLDKKETPRKYGRRYPDALIFRRCAGAELVD
jgi:hypothetical protein